MDQAEIRRRIRERLDNGALLGTRYARIRGGTGAGVACAECDDPIRSDDLEIEVQFPTPTGVTGRRFHPLCLAIWELERQQK
jgi:hypothetical protein